MKKTTCIDHVCSSCGEIFATTLSNNNNITRISKGVEFIKTVEAPFDPLKQKGMPYSRKVFKCSCGMEMSILVRFRDLT